MSEVAPTVPRSSVGALAATLTDCLCRTLTDFGSPVCECCLIHYEDPLPAQGCTCNCTVTTPDGREVAANGVALVRVTAVDAADSGTNLRGDLLNNCRTMQLVVELELAVMRCITIPDAEDDGIDCPTRSLEALQALADEACMRWAVACCGETEELRGGWQMIPGRWEPAGPSGGCQGGRLAVTALGQMTRPFNNNPEEP